MNAETAIPNTFTTHYEMDAPVEAVWNALTDSTVLAKWLMDNDLVPEVGRRFTFRAQPMPHWDGIVNCEVLAVEPMSRLSYTWKGGTLDTVVTWTLTPNANGGTTLRLDHSGFTEADRFAYDGMSNGWAGLVGKRLKELVENRSEN
jgi:uncharacterized protein YndB with AHSA1/START domain